MGNNPSDRLAPTDVPAEAVERIAGRRGLTILRGDVVLSHERLPRVNPASRIDEPQWRFRVCIDGTRDSSELFTSFPRAASRADEIAAARRTRLIFVEDDLPSLLADYRG
jgi:hypothetical protein